MHKHKRILCPTFHGFGHPAVSIAAPALRGGQGLFDQEVGENRLQPRRAPVGTRGYADRAADVARRIADDGEATGLKLDLSFTRLILKDSTARQLAAGLAALARGLDLVSIAEGVEEQAQVELLRSQGWSLGQGWLFGEAAPEPVTRVA